MEQKAHVKSSTITIEIFISSNTETVEIAKLRRIRRSEIQSTHKKNGKVKIITSHSIFKKIVAESLTIYLKVINMSGSFRRCDLHHLFKPSFIFLYFLAFILTLHLYKTGEFFLSNYDFLVKEIKTVTYNLFS